MHIDDVVGIYLRAIDNVQGPLNATAPQPVRNEEFTELLARELHRPRLIPAPAFMIKMALGEGATLVLDGQRVLPERTMQEGYTFKYPQLEGALANLLA